MILDIDPSNGVPIFMQVVQQVKYKIATGTLTSGEQLPSVRQLASNLRVNPNTISRAYTDLERDGVIKTRRGMGCFVADNPVTIEKAERLNLVGRHLDRALTEAYHLKIAFDEVNQLLQERNRVFMEGRAS
ncbi:MAG: GntR family transcriptional regulator [Candidatus Hinthialibacter antarcticus]|nr:GntR family transcriptional regulator [Candidatus Hinthialibacter antarcticus]